MVRKGVILTTLKRESAEKEEEDTHQYHTVLKLVLTIKIISPM